MARAGITPEERVGLVLAVALHLGVLALLVMQPAAKPRPAPHRMEVTLSDKVGLTDTAPPSTEQAAADIAPRLGAAPPPPAPAPAVQTPPQQTPAPPRPRLLPAPTPLQLPPPPLERQLPHPVAPRPLPPRPVMQPAPPKPAPAKPTPARPAPEPPKPQPTTHPATHPHPPQAETAAEEPPAHPAKTAGGSRIGADFLKGVTSANTTGKAKTPPAQTAGPAVQSALLGAIFRQLRPNWHAPQGMDAEKLETCLAWDLKLDGTLDGAPRLTRPQDGVTDSNRPQASRHLEQALRAVELAEPFQLPPEYYTTWKHVGPICFNRKMSQ